MLLRPVSGTGPLFTAGLFARADLRTGVFEPTGVVGAGIWDAGAGLDSFLRFVAGSPDVGDGVGRAEVLLEGLTGEPFTIAWVCAMVCVVVVVVVVVAAAWLD